MDDKRFEQLKIGVDPVRGLFCLFIRAFILKRCLFVEPFPFGVDKVFGFAKIKVVNPPCAAFGPRRVFTPPFLRKSGV